MVLVYHKRKAKAAYSRKLERSQDCVSQESLAWYYFLFMRSGLFASFLAILSASDGSNFLAFMQNLALHS